MATISLRARPLTLIERETPRIVQDPRRYCRGLPRHVAIRRDHAHAGASMEDSMATRTTHRSSSGKKLYAVRDASGRFKDIQTYERAHRADLKKRSKVEAKAVKKH
jgi:hypothetical protein